MISRVEEFYQQIQLHTGRAEALALPELPDLLTHLRGYQKRAVGWMLEREKGGGGGGMGGSLHKLWREVSLVNTSPDLPNIKLYFNPYTLR